MEPKICPNCKEKNNPEFEKCWKCAYSFTDGKQSDVPLIHKAKKCNEVVAVGAFVVALAIAGLVMFISSGAIWTAKTSITAEGVFKDLIANPIPSSVKIVGSKLDSEWQSFDYYIVFTINKSDFNKIISGYKACSDEEGKAFKNEIENLAKISDYRCYKKKKPEATEEFYICWDETQSKALFYGRAW